MSKPLELDILPQPDDLTCGPTCLHAVYRYFEDHVPLDQVVQEVPRLDDGGTLAVLLATHALARGYVATIYTYNLNVFDPTWFEAQNHEGESEPVAVHRRDLVDRLQAQMAIKQSPRLQTASRAYIEFLRSGGQIRMRDLSANLIRKYLQKSVPILTGLSATYLYRSPREFGPLGEPDDTRGLPMGHFVVLCGYQPNRQTVLVADPYLPNPLGSQHYYEVGLERLVSAILLGVLTYDANLLIIEPRTRAPQRCDLPKKPIARG